LRKESFMSSIMSITSDDSPVVSFAEDAGAIIKIGKSVRVNFTILDKYMDALSGE